MTKDLRQMLKRFRKMDGRVSLSNGGHYQLTHPASPGVVVTIPSTPSSYSALANIRASIKRLLGVAL